jgi:pyruvate formate lyase activating enzyme
MICPNHRDESRIISASIGYCPTCIEENTRYQDEVRDMHSRLRKKKGLVPQIPRSGKIVCAECGNHCRLGEGEDGFCSLRMGQQGQIVEKYPGNAIVSWYFDPLPTNCVADWVCPVVTTTEIKTGPGRLKNLAVFYGSCSSDCLFCQNLSYQEMMKSGTPLMTPTELAGVADESTACVCYFGGDPACNPRHSVEVSKLLIEQHQTRICYETNGNISGKWLSKISDVVWDSNGTIKFDLKAVTPSLYTALTGINNGAVLKNFKKLSRRGKDRESEFLVASILLVPGYIGMAEVGRLCDYIASCDPTIPTALLGFHPHHVMRDLPRTSRTHADAASLVARESGLTNVRVGNKHLLSNADYDYS